MPKPKMKLLQDGTLMLFGVIGDEFDGLDSASVVEQIRSVGEVDILHVMINSPGGFVDDGLAIYNELATAPFPVDIEITGVAASMASAIAMAGNPTRIAENALVMIHDPWSVGVGNAEDLRKAAETLEKFGDSLVGIYARKTGLEEEQVRDMMAEETWLNAQEALEHGFVDEIISPSEAQAFAEIDTSELRNVPAALTDLIREGRRAAAAASKNKPGDRKMPPKQINTPPPDSGTDPSSEELRAAWKKEDQDRRAGIRKLFSQFESQLGDSADAFLAEHVDGDTSVEDFRAKLLERMAEVDADGAPNPVPPGPVEVGDDARDKWMAGMERWLLVKAGAAGMIEKHTGNRPDPGECRGFRLIDIARDSLEMRGESVRGVSPMEIARRAFIGGPRAESAGLGTRSDFPILLENVLHKMLQAAYDTAEDQWRDVASRGSVQDFRAHPRLRLGSLPRLDSLLESGEFRQLHFPDAEKESIAASTFGNLIGLTRHAIVNDDMDGFARLVTMLGRAAARSIEIDVFALFELNGGLGPTMADGNTLFHANHSNIAGTGGAPSVSLLEESRVLMAQQQDPDGNDFLNLRPDVWVGPIGFGADARVAVNSEFDVEAETSGGSGQFRRPNVVRDLVSAIVDTPRLSGTRWYLLADPDIAPVFEVVFLEGQESPVIETELGFDYDGIRWRVRHDYGVGATDYRGATTNAGV